MAIRQTGRPKSRLLRWWLLFAPAFAAALGWARPAAAEDALAELRDDVRRLPVIDEPPPKPERHRRHHYDDEDPDPDGTLTGMCMAFSLLGVTSPVWMPIAATEDDFGLPGYFQRFPYHRTDGHMIRPDRHAGDVLDYETWPEVLAHEPAFPLLDPFRPRLRRWSARLRAEYADEFDDIRRITGHLLFSTTSRFGLDTEMSYFQEDKPGPASDQLWLGDCNLIFRFAQDEKVQWRLGAGLNWLDDPQETNYGFNFTYGVDWFPRRPWVLSASLDAGTLGHAGLFRFRTTSGVIVWGIESYVGYEYLDIGRTQLSSLIGGVRLWF
jgi:hypothetical protein